jgi:hypothetical protein
LLLDQFLSLIRCRQNQNQKEILLVPSWFSAR